MYNPQYTIYISKDVHHLRLNVLDNLQQSNLHIQNLDEGLYFSTSQISVHFVCFLISILLGVGIIGPKHCVLTQIKCTDERQLKFYSLG